MTGAEIVTVDDLPAYRPIKGMSGRAVFGQRIQVTHVVFEPHSTVPVHTHPQEQIGMLLKGDAELAFDDGTRQRLAGHCAYVVPPDVPHGLIVGAEGAEFVETFFPIRQDYYLHARDGVEPEPFQ
ncbi:cupin domain-containing protein [Mycolicibacterium porcinum]|uniref:cupin domain-containing protein n=1 Tax=Mycolicibacterium porcinum TaxID=39693 RepID=UPI00256EA00D|nr:cupin domain-containing protein [Mycolicibacterium porcinum]